MVSVKDNSHHAVALWPALAGLGLCAFLKGVAAAWGGSEILLAQACFTAGELLVLWAVFPSPGWEACRGRKAKRRFGVGPVKRGFIFASALLLLGVGAGLLRLGMVLLDASGPASPTGTLALAVIFIAVVQLVLWRIFSFRGGGRRSLGAAVIAVSYRADLFLLGGVVVVAAAAWRGWPVFNGLAVAGLGILILFQALELARRGLWCPAEPRSAERLLRPVRERVSDLEGLVAIHKITQQPGEPGGGLNLHLEVIMEDATLAAGIEQNVRLRLAESFAEISRVSVQANPLSSIRESIRRRARYL